MFRKLRAHLSYANVMASIAIFIALGGGAYAASIAPKNSVVSSSIRNGQVKRVDIAKNAVTNSRIGPNAVGTGKIRDNAVTTTKLVDGSVTTPKLADGSVTTPKLAANSVNGLLNIQDGTVTGADVLEDTLHFGCANITVQGLGNAGPYTVGTNGFCAFVLHPSGSGRTWNQAANDCTGVVADSTLANPAQIEELQATNGGAQGPVTGATNMWTTAPNGSSSMWTVHVGNGGTVTDFAGFAISTLNPAPIVCVYQPASKNG